MADAAWWQRGVIYQICPRSFMDSDGHGGGDLPGVLSRLAPPGLALAGRVALSTHPDRDGDPVAAPLELRGDEGVVVELG